MIEINPNSQVVFNLEMNSFERNDAKLRSLRHDIAKKYNLPLKNVMVEFTPIAVDENGNKVSLTSDIITNVQDPKFQQSLFKEYIEAKKIEGIDFDEILNIDNQVNAFVDFDAYSKYKSYKFKYAKWKNYLSYGEDNYIDFTKLRGLVLLCGNPQNQSGKSSFARNLLRFALFGKAEKSPDLASVFNSFLPEATEVVVEVGIEIEGDDYVIRRTITRPKLAKRTAKSKYTQNVEYFKVTNGELCDIENCEGESNVQTNNIIKDSIGTIEDFDLIISATAKTLSDLFEMGQTDQGKLFSRWLGLLSLGEKETIAKDLYKKNVEPTLLSAKYSKSSLEDEVKNMETVISDDEKKIKEYQESLLACQNKIISLNTEKTETLSKKKEIKDELTKIDVATVENQIKMMDEKLVYERSLFTNEKTRYKEIQGVTFSESDYKGKLKEKEDLIKENSSIKTQIGLLKEEIAKTKKLIEQKICPNCGQKVDVAEKTNIIAEKTKVIEKLISNGVENKAKIDAIDHEIEVLDENRTKVNELAKLKLSLTARKAQIDNYKLKTDTLIKTKSDIEANRDNIVYNNEIMNKIRITDENIANETKIKDNYIRETEAYKLEITNYTSTIKTHKETIAKLIEEEKLIRNWSVYKELIGKNGIIKIVLKRALPIINNEVHTLLDGLVDFDVELSISDDNKISINLLRDGVSMNIGRAASGYEETMSSLAVRSALATVSSFAKPNMLVLDEIFGATGSSHYDDIHELLKRIMRNHDFIIDITHNEMITDWHDMTIEVSKENNISTLMVR